MDLWSDYLVKDVRALIRQYLRAGRGDVGFIDAFALARTCRAEYAARAVRGLEAPRTRGLGRQFLFSRALMAPEVSRNQVLWIMDECFPSTEKLDRVQQAVDEELPRLLAARGDAQLLDAWLALGPLAHAYQQLIEGIPSTQDAIETLCSHLSPSCLDSSSLVWAARSGNLGLYETLREHFQFDEKAHAGAIMDAAVASATLPMLIYAVDHFWELFDDSTRANYMWHLFERHPNVEVLRWWFTQAREATERGASFRGALKEVGYDILDHILYRMFYGEQVAAPGMTEILEVIWKNADLWTTSPTQIEPSVTIGSHVFERLYCSLWFRCDPGLYPIVNHFFPFWTNRNLADELLPKIWRAPIHAAKAPKFFNDFCYAATPDRFRAALRRFILQGNAEDRLFKKHWIRREMERDGWPSGELAEMRAALEEQRQLASSDL